MYVQTTATIKISKLTKRIRAIAGGTSASKTISILMLLIDYAQTHKNRIISVVSETMPHLRKGAMRDFQNIMRENLYWLDSRWNKTDSIYTFETGSFIEFFSADNPARVRGPRRHVLFINEANNVTYDTFDQLSVRTSEFIFLDWNPVSEFWFYKDENDNPGVISRDDVEFITVNYQDNEALPVTIIRDIETHKNNPAWWRVYGEGQLGEAKGRIYTGWIQVDGVPTSAELKRYGLDFGYSNDPTALIAVYKYEKGYLLDELLYRKQLSNRDIATVILEQPKGLVIADSSEPKSIDEISSYGIKNIIPAAKGKDSILHGIQYIQDQTIYVTKGSTNIIREYRNYLWLTDPKTGKSLNVPQDFMNHAMDAIRYAMDIKQQEKFVMNNNVGGVKRYYNGIPG